MPAHGTCATCKLDFCRDCLADARAGRMRCVTCAAAGRGARARKLVAGGVAVAALAGVGIPLVLNELRDEPTDEPAVTADAGFDYGNRWIIVRDLIDAYKADSCNSRLAERLAKEMNRAGNHKGVVDLTHDYLANCGPHMDLLWSTVYAHEQRQEWQPAADLATLLIEDAPYDSDFWWWRGKHYRNLGRHAEAEADLRQSMAALPNEFASGELYALSKLTMKPCPAAFAIRRFIDQRPDRAGQRARQMRDELYQLGSCVNLEGRGTARLRRNPDAPVSTVRVAVGDATGTFILDPSVGYVTLTRGFADRAGVAPAGDSVAVFAGGEHRPAQLGEAAVISVGKARADRVAVAVVADALPNDADGILGLSFLWRFRVDEHYDGLVLSRLPR